ncbi:MAG TPA: hypothetical protein VJ872_11000 [Nocardioides sp.]|nr:hypothetical protein [Nocardioides sp.]
MTTSVTTDNPVRSDLPTRVVRPQQAQGRRWPLAGIGAAVAGIGTIVTSSMVNGVYDQDLVGQPDRIAEKIASQTGAMFAFHSITVIGAMLMIVFAAGLFGRLRSVVGTSTAAVVALAGWIGTAVVMMLGSGLDTEFMMSMAADDKSVDSYNAALYNHWIGTIPWVWGLAGLSGLALFAIARRGGVPRWIGVVGLVLGGLTTLLGVSPLEYMAAVTGVLMLLVTAIGFTVGDRAFRGTR